MVEKRGAFCFILLVIVFHFVNTREKVYTPQKIDKSCCVVNLFGVAPKISQVFKKLHKKQEYIRTSFN